MQIFGAPPTDTPCQRRSAAYAVIVRDDGHVATVCVNVRGEDKYWLPGGGMHAGESPEETIVREVREELAREVHLVRPLDTALQYFYAGDEDAWYEMIAHFYLAEVNGETDAVAEYALRWIDPQRSGSDFFHQCHVWAISAAAER